MLVVTVDDENVVIGGSTFRRNHRLSDLDCSDGYIRQAIEATRNSKLPNPAFLVINPEAFDDKQFDYNRKFNSQLDQTMRNVVGILVQSKVLCDANESYYVFPNPLPYYLAEIKGDKISHRDFFMRFLKPEFAGLASLVVWGKENVSRDYYGPDGKPKYFFFHTKNSAPVEFSLSDLESISSAQTTLNNGIYTVTVIMKNGVKVTFGGMSAVNPDFQKSDQEPWKTVVGLSSPNGFTIAVAYKDGDNLVSVSGDAIRKNTLNIQDKLPKSLVRMIKIGIPGVDFLSDSDAKVRVAGAVSLAEIKDPCSVEVLATLLKDSNVAVRTAAGCALGQIKDPIAAKSLCAAMKDIDWHVREAAVTALGEIRDMDAVESLLVAMKSDEWRVRYAAVVALGKIKDKRAVEPLVMVLRDQDDWRMRKATAIALGQIGDALAAEPLLNVLKEPRKPLSDLQFEVQSAAAQALIETGGTLTARNDILPHWSPLVAIRLGESGDKRAIPLLVDNLPNWEKNGVYGKLLSALGWQPQTEREQVYFWICMRQATVLTGNWEQTRHILLEDMQSGDNKRMYNAVFTFICLGREDIISELVMILTKQGSKEMAEAYLNCGNEQLRMSAEGWANRYGYTITPGQGSSPVSWGKW
jgi:hypothetical protein